MKYGHVLYVVFCGFSGRNDRCLFLRLDTRTLISLGAGTNIDLDTDMMVAS